MGDNAGHLDAPRSTVPLQQVPYYNVCLKFLHDILQPSYQLIVSYVLCHFCDDSESLQSFNIRLKRVHVLQLRSLPVLATFPNYEFGNNDTTFVCFSHTTVVTAETRMLCSLLITVYIVGLLTSLKLKNAVNQYIASSIHIF